MKEDLKIAFDHPAEKWEEALPVGNGRLGGMIFGQPFTERIQLNEDSVWFGGKQERLNPSALENLPKIRELIFDGKIKEAQELCALALSGIPEEQRHYEPLQLSGQCHGHQADGRQTGGTFLSTAVREREKPLVSLSLSRADLQKTGLSNIFGCGLCCRRHDSGHGLDARQGLRRCLCKAMMEKSNFCRHCRSHGKTERSQDFVPEEGLR